MKKEELKRSAASIDRDLREIRRLLFLTVACEIDRSGLTGVQQSAMQVLVKHEGISLRELSEELGLAHSTVSGVVDRLGKKGLIERRTNEADRRATKIVATKAVRNFLQKGWTALEAQPLAEALGRANATERKSIVEGIAALKKLLERPGAPGR